MKRKFKLWDKTEDITLISGRRCTPATIMKEFPFTAISDTVLGYSGRPGGPVLIGSIDNLDILMEVYNVDENLTAEEAVVEIARIANEPPNVEEAAL